MERQQENDKKLFKKCLYNLENKIPLHLEKICTLAPVQALTECTARSEHVIILETEADKKWRDDVTLC